MLNDVGGVQGPQRIPPDPTPRINPAEAPNKPARTDAVEISQEARLLEKLSKVPQIREAKVEELRRLIADGTYETTERLEGAVDRILDELLDR